jgi:hypothetical protein
MSTATGMPFEPPAAAEPADGSRDWRLTFGLGLTALWLALGFVYIAYVIGWVDFVRQGAPDLGSFLEGAFAPLAFLWLVIGFFLQQRQLTENTDAIERQYRALRKSAEQAEIQARAIAANEMHARQDTFIEVARMVNEQLGVISGYLWMSSQGPHTEDERIAEMWRHLGSGDHATFSRLLISLSFSGGETARELFWSTPIRTRHSENLVRTFERLLRNAERCDPDGMIADAIRGQGHGRVYSLVVESRPASPPTGG